MISHSIEKQSAFQKLKLLLVSPNSFFHSIRSPKVGWEPVIWSIFSFLFFSIMNLVLFFSVQIGFLSFPLWTLSIDFTNAITFFMGLMIYVFYGVLLIVTIPLMHFIAKKLGGKGSYDDMVKGIFYPWTLFFLLGWIPIVGWVVSFWECYIMYRGFRVLYSFSSGRAVAFIVSASVVLLLLALVVAALLAFVVALLFLLLIRN